MIPSVYQAIQLRRLVVLSGNLFERTRRKLDIFRHLSTEPLKYWSLGTSKLRSRNDTTFRWKWILVLWLFNNALRMLGLYRVERWMIVRDDKFGKKKWNGMRVFR